MAEPTFDIQKLYVTYFGRPADSAGLDYWTGILAANPNGLQDISRAFMASSEYRAEYAGDSNRDIIDDIYENLFERDAQAADLNYWSGLLDRNEITIDTLVEQIANGATGSDKVVFEGKVALATMFTERLDLPSEQAAYAGERAIDLAEDFLETVRDQATLDAALNPAVVDYWIARMTGAQGAGAEQAALVGVQVDPELLPVF